MKRPLVQISPLSADGTVRVEVNLFCTWAGAFQTANPNKILDVNIIPVAGVTPAPMARNQAVAGAQKMHADILFMVDDDMDANREFFEIAVEFLKQHDGPAVIASPYCCAPPQEDAMVFEWISGQSHTPVPHWKLERIRREDAARRRGIEKVANVGTGLIAYRMDAFDRIQPPYFDYTYDARHEKVLETEDCFFHRHLAIAGVPVYVSWDHWSGHWKAKRVGKPEPISQAHIDALYLREAAEELRGHWLMPHDIPGNETDQSMVHVFAAVVADLKDGAAVCEVGCWLGRSTILLANIIKQARKKIVQHAVDTFEGSSDEPYQLDAVRLHGGSVRKAFEANLERYGVKGVTILAEPSVAAARQFSEGSLDFVFIDAQHSVEAVTADIDAWRQKVKPGGILAGHDYDWEPVRTAVAKMLPLSEVIVHGCCWIWGKAADSSPPR